MKIVVSNTTPIIGLAMLGKFNLLQSLFNVIHIPQAVYDEIAVRGVNRIGAAEVTQGIADGWIVVKQIHPSNALTTLKVDLDDGEAEAITMAIQENADLILLDEMKARAKAQALALQTTGTIGILLLARKANIHINLQQSLDQLRGHGFRISEELYRQILTNNP